MTPWENFKDAAQFGITAGVGLAGLMAGLGVVIFAIAAIITFVGKIAGLV